MGTSEVLTKLPPNTWVWIRLKTFRWYSPKDEQELSERLFRGNEFYLGLNHELWVTE